MLCALAQDSNCKELQAPISRRNAQWWQHSLRAATVTKLLQLKMCDTQLNTLTDNEIARDAWLYLALVAKDGVNIEAIGTRFSTWGLSHSLHLRTADDIKLAWCVMTRGEFIVSEALENSGYKASADFSSNYVYLLPPIPLYKKISCDMDDLAAQTIRE